jgi:hypothetical protein
MKKLNGFIFQIKDNYYFTPSDYKSKTKTVAKIFLDSFLNDKYKDCGFVPLHIVNNTFNKIYHEMRHATIEKSENNAWYYIHEKDAGATIPIHNMTIITKGVK